ncbi:MAG: fimbrial protein [Rhizobiaceae bacterium]|jgi:hypothetical protein|nr:fimbrial protein [Rhizobiaceae bacterium]
MTHNFDDEDDKPLDPAVDRVRRKLVRFMAINLGLLFLALMAVAVAIVYRMGSRGEEAPAEVAVGTQPGEFAAQGSIKLPDGARVVSQSLSGTLLSVEVAGGAGEREFMIYDLAEGSVVARIAVER